MKPILHSLGSYTHDMTCRPWKYSITHCLSFTSVRFHPITEIFSHFSQRLSYLAIILNIMRVSEISHQSRSSHEFHLRSHIIVAIWWLFLSTLKNWLVVELEQVSYVFQPARLGHSQFPLSDYSLQNISDF